MRINHNISALNTWHNQMINSKESEKTIGALSSGLRINQASDDAAGLSISEKMRAQIRGLSQASRNIQDGISLVQTAEGGLNEIHSLLQRGRELSVQAANDTNTTGDKQNIQEEIDQIKQEVDRISNNTQFNTLNLLNVASAKQDEKDLKNLLQTSWLGQAEKRINDYLGIHADRATMTVFYDRGGASDGVGGKVAYVQATVPAAGGGLGTSLELHVDMADFDAGVAEDSVVAHEILHAVFDRTVNVGQGTGLSQSADKWFNEGVAEFIRGADDQILNNYGDVATDAVQRAALIANASTTFANWGTLAGSKDYATAYTAVRFIHDSIKAAGGNGIKDMVQWMAADPVNRTLGQAFTNATHGAFIDRVDFQAKFAAQADGFIQAKIKVTNADVGGIGGSDADSGAVLNRADVVPDGAQSVQYFNMVYPSTSTADDLQMQIGANTGQSMGVSLSKVDTVSLGIKNVNVVTNAKSAIGSFDSAIAIVSQERSKFGALQNRLEHAMSVATNSEENLTTSESRIRDADMAKEMMKSTKMNILSQATQAMLAQANQSSQAILQILH
ncbi:flagellinolysin [Brevibacillus ginsengisoli]|uniref:flagellinolysin n=1 Tax=Brevibacillus ginsengisoli TaxID=363854 RepID=UPI003CF19B83